MKKIVVFTGAGVSADSGVATFRDADDLWVQHRIEDVCTPEALVRNSLTFIKNVAAVGLPKLVDNLVKNK